MVSQSITKTLLTCILLSLIHNVYSIEYWMSMSTGSDANDGTSVGTPWQTFNRLNQVIGRLRSGDKVHFCQGDRWSYSMISGTTAGVTYDSYNCRPGFTSRPTITPAVDLDYRKWSVSPNDTNVLVYDISADSMALANGFKALWVNNTRQQLARWPNLIDPSVVYGRVGEFVQMNNISGTTLASSALAGYPTDYFAGAHITWRQANWIYFDGYFRSSDPAGTAQLDSNWGTQPNFFFYLEANFNGRFPNHRAWLDQAGEWMIDVAAGAIYLIPLDAATRDGILDGSIRCSALYPNLASAAVFQAATTVTGLEFTHGIGGVTVMAANVVFTNNAIRNVLERGFYVTRFFNGVLFQNNVVDDCESTCVMTQGTTSHVLNNVISRCGLYPRSTPSNSNGAWNGITITGGTARGNVVTGCGYACVHPHQGSVVDSNIITDAMMTMNDGGAVYAYGSNDNYAVITNNVIRNTVGNIAAYFPNRLAPCIYMDENSYGGMIRNNTCIEAPGCLMFNKAYSHTFIMNECQSPGIYINHGAGHITAGNLMVSRGTNGALQNPLFRMYDTINVNYNSDFTAYDQAYCTLGPGYQFQRQIKTGTWRYDQFSDWRAAELPVNPNFERGSVHVTNCDGWKPINIYSADPWAFLRSSSSSSSSTGVSSTAISSSSSSPVYSSSSSSSSSPAYSSTAESSSVAPSSTAESSSVEPSSTAQSSTAEPSTAEVPSSTASSTAQSSTAESSSSSEQTVESSSAVSSTAESSSVQPSSTAESSTVEPSSTAQSSTAVESSTGQSSTAESSSVQPSSTAESSTAEPSSTAQSSTAVESSTGQSSTGDASSSSSVAPVPLGRCLFTGPFAQPTAMMSFTVTIDEVDNFTGEKLMQDIATWYRVNQSVSDLYDPLAVFPRGLQCGSLRPISVTARRLLSNLYGTSLTSSSHMLTTYIVNVPQATQLANVFTASVNEVGFSGPLSGSHVDTGAAQVIPNCADGSPQPIGGQCPDIPSSTAEPIVPSSTAAEISSTAAFSSSVESSSSVVSSSAESSSVQSSTAESSSAQSSTAESSTAQSSTAVESSTADVSSTGLVESSSSASQSSSSSAVDSSSVVESSSAASSPSAEPAVESSSSVASTGVESSSATETSTAVESSTGAESSTGSESSIEQSSTAAESSTAADASSSADVPSSSSTASEMSSSADASSASESSSAGVESSTASESSSEAPVEPSSATEPSTAEQSTGTEQSTAEQPTGAEQSTAEQPSTATPASTGSPQESSIPEQSTGTDVSSSSGCDEGCFIPVEPEEVSHSSDDSSAAVGGAVGGVIGGIVLLVVLALGVRYFRSMRSLSANGVLYPWSSPSAVASSPSWSPSFNALKNSPSLSPGPNHEPGHELASFNLQDSPNMSPRSSGFLSESPVARSVNANELPHDTHHHDHPKFSFTLSEADSNQPPSPFPIQGSLSPSQSFAPFLGAPMSPISPMSSGSWSPSQSCAQYQAMPPSPIGTSSQLQPPQSPISPVVNKQAAPKTEYFRMPKLPLQLPGKGKKFGFMNRNQPPAFPAFTQSTVLTVTPPVAPKSIPPPVPVTNRPPAIPTTLPTRSIPPPVPTSHLKL